MEIKVRESSSDIDFVITWVDGADEEWLTQKLAFEEVPQSSIDDEKYRDWNLLRYWFRGVEKYAPWVRKIHFVTWGHYPSWLNAEHPKLQIVKHSDFIPKQYLPTFSSHAIELNLHRIKGLSEKFVYFNDDTFLVRPVSESDFFLNELPCGAPVLVPFRTLKGDWLTAPLNNIAVINDHFDFHASIKNHFFKWFNIRYGAYNLISAWMLPYRSFYGFLEFHLPNSYLKSTFEKVWNLEGKILNETSSHKFRERSDVNQWLFENWQFAEGSFIPRSPKFGKAFYLSDHSESNLELLYKYIANQEGSIVCVNDGRMDQDTFCIIQNSVKRAFEENLNQACSFELHNDGNKEQ